MVEWWRSVAVIVHVILDGLTWRNRVQGSVPGYRVYTTQLWLSVTDVTFLLG